jgi:PucR C-terminal helix-turn-helix domain/GGDEF-like domain
MRGPAKVESPRDTRSDALIRQWGARFQNDPLAANVIAGLRERSSEIWQHAFELMKRESPEYRYSVDEEFTKESKAHCRELLALIISVAAGTVTDAGQDPFEFVRTHAEWRARHQVPLIASLHAYRLAHRTYSEISQDSLSRHRNPKAIIRSLRMLSDFWIQFFDFVGAVLAEAYAVEDGLFVAQGTRSYTALITDLLRGVRPADPESRRLCTLCGIRPGAPMAVAVAAPHWPGNGSLIDREVTLRTFVRLFEQVLSPAHFGRLVDIRNSQVIAIASSDGDTARRVLRALQGRGFAGRAGNGYSARVGVSLDVVEIAHLPEALEEAQTALELSSDGQPMLHFASIDLQELLVRRADRTAVRLIPEWARHLNSAEDGPSRELSRTIRVFADSSFNVKLTAQRLGVHTNTVYFRLNRIKKLTGIDPRTYSGTSLFLTILRMLEIHGGVTASKFHPPTGSVGPA